MTTTNQNVTPMLRQYQELKRQHPGTLLFFRLGDFYELFFEDAITGARELEITLTARHKERGQPVPMCGVPHHSVAGHVARLIRKGYRVAICEQTEDPSKAKKLVRREVVRVITPGTLIDPNLVEARETVFLAAVCGAGERFGAAFLDLSTGEFRATEVCGQDSWARVRADIESYAPRELLFPASLAPLVRDAYAGRGTRTTPLPLSDETEGAPLARITPAMHNASPTTTTDGIALTPLDEWLWEPTSCASLLLEQFGARTLEGFGLGGKIAAVCAAGACLRYARETQRAAAAHVTDISFFETHDHLVLDAVTCRNLELFESQGASGRGASLLDVLDATVTGMGARLLRSWLMRPSVRRGEIESRHTIAALETRERARSGIQNLRVRFNNVFGYFIEVSKAGAARVPADYERRQTLANAERYTTPELKEWERKVLGAESRILEIETRIFGEIRSQVARETRRLQATARALSILDALASLAEVAVRRRYRRPLMHDGDELEIKAGRHPVIEAIGEAPFVPNDLYLNNSTDRLLIITGPNMGGKSTLLRQTALIALMAQMGSFVPAEHARLPILDRIWTRVGASDDLSRGRSTFMVEMTETAAILHNAGPRSLVLLDEIGRGTATFDGLSIAWSVAEYLHDSPDHAAKTLFATHYHELTELAERLPGAQNYQITATEREGEVVFLHRLERGRASKSSGIEVARLAGMPSSALARAREVLRRLERYELDVFAEEEGEIKERAIAAGATANLPAEDRALTRAAFSAARRRIAAQSSLFDLANQK